MSDVSQGSGWWQASDGKWYSPEQTPGVASQPQAPPVSGAAEPLSSSAVPDPCPRYPDGPTRLRPTTQRPRLWSAPHGTTTWPGLSHGG